MAYSVRLIPYMATDKNTIVDKLFKAGAHFAMAKARRHPSAKPYIFGAKNKVEIFDLEETEKKLHEAVDFIKSVASTGKQILFVSGKSEAIDLVNSAADKCDQPRVAGRWIGGTLTNFVEIRKRVEKFERLSMEKEKGELTKYTKKERLLIDREIENLEIMFGGIVPMKEKPAALVIIDSKQEEIAVLEAKQLGIPVVALASSDCDLSLINYPVPANDSNTRSIGAFLEEIANAYIAGRSLKAKVE